MNQKVEKRQTIQQKVQKRKIEQHITSYRHMSSVVTMFFYFQTVIFTKSRINENRHFNIIYFFLICHSSICYTLLGNISSHMSICNIGTTTYFDPEYVAVK